MKILFSFRGIPIIVMSFILSLCLPELVSTDRVSNIQYNFHTVISKLNKSIEKEAFFIL